MIILKLRQQAAFTLSETMMSIAVTAISLAAFFAATSQAVRIVRSGKEIAAASQILQQRIETFRYAPPWSRATTPEGVASMVKNAAAAPSSFPEAAETFTVAPYPAGGEALVVTRNSDGTVTSSGPSLIAEKCVQIRATVTWTGVGGVKRTREMSTILTKGGL